MRGCKIGPWNAKIIYSDTSRKKRTCYNTIRAPPISFDDRDDKINRLGVDKLKSDFRRKWQNGRQIDMANEGYRFGGGFARYSFTRTHYIEYEFLGTSGANLNKIQIFCPVPFERLSKFKILTKIKNGRFEPLLDLRVTAHKDLNTQKDFNERNNIWSGKRKYLIKRNILRRRNHYRKQKPIDDKTFLDEKVKVSNIWSEVNGVVRVPFHTKQIDIEFSKTRITKLRLVIMETDYQRYFGRTTDPKLGPPRPKEGTKYRCNSDSYDDGNCVPSNITISKVMFLETLKTDGKTKGQKLDVDHLCRRGISCAAGGDVC